MASSICCYGGAGAAPGHAPNKCSPKCAAVSTIAVLIFSGIAAVGVLALLGKISIPYQQPLSYAAIGVGGFGNLMVFVCLLRRCCKPAADEVQSKVIAPFVLETSVAEVHDYFMADAKHTFYSGSPTLFAMRPGFDGQRLVTQYNSTFPAGPKIRFDVNCFRRIPA